MNASDTPNNASHFAFGRSNFVWLGIGIAVLILGYVLMSGGGLTTPTCLMKASSASVESPSRPQWCSRDTA